MMPRTPVTEPSSDQQEAWRKAAESVTDAEKPWWWDKPWPELGYGGQGDVQAWFQNRDPLRRAVEPNGPDIYVRRHCDPRPHFASPSPVSGDAGDLAERAELPIEPARFSQQAIASNDANLPDVEGIPFGDPPKGGLLDGRLEMPSSPIPGDAEDLVGQGESTREIVERRNGQRCPMCGSSWSYDGEREDSPLFCEICDDDPDPKEQRIADRAGQGEPVASKIKRTIFDWVREDLPQSINADINYEHISTLIAKLRPFCAAPAPSTGDGESRYCCRGPSALCDEEDLTAGPDCPYCLPTSEHPSDTRAREIIRQAAARLEKLEANEVIKLFATAPSPCLLPDLTGKTIVPLEPTEAILKAGQRAADVREAYRAMVAAATDEFRLTSSRTLDPTFVACNELRGLINAVVLAKDALHPTLPEQDQMDALCDAVSELEEYRDRGVLDYDFWVRRASSRSAAGAEVLHPPSTPDDEARDEPLIHSSTPNDE